LYVIREHDPSRVKVLTSSDTLSLPTSSTSQLFSLFSSSSCLSLLLQYHRSGIPLLLYCCSHNHLREQRAECIYHEEHRLPIPEQSLIFQVRIRAFFNFYVPLNYWLGAPHTRKLTREPQQGATTQPTNRFVYFFTMDATGPLAVLPTAGGSGWLSDIIDGRTSPPNAATAGSLPPSARTIQQEQGLIQPGVVVPVEPFPGWLESSATTLPARNASASEINNFAQPADDTDSQNRGKWLSSRVNFEDEASLEAFGTLWKGLVQADQQPSDTHSQQEPQQHSNPSDTSKKTPKRKSLNRLTCLLRPSSSSSTSEDANTHNSNHNCTHKSADFDVSWADFEDEDQMLAFEGLLKFHLEQDADRLDDEEGKKERKGKGRKGKSRRTKRSPRFGGDKDQHVHSDGEEDEEDDRGKRKLSFAMITGSGSVLAQTKKIDSLRKKFGRTRFHTPPTSPTSSTSQLPSPHQPQHPHHQDAQLVLPLCSELKAEFKKLKGIP